MWLRTLNPCLVPSPDNSALLKRALVATHIKSHGWPHCLRWLGSSQLLDLPRRSCTALLPAPSSQVSFQPCPLEEGKWESGITTGKIPTATKRGHLVEPNLYEGMRETAERRPKSQESMERLPHGTISQRVRVYLSNSFCNWTRHRDQ